MAVGAVVGRPDTVGAGVADRGAVGAAVGTAAEGVDEGTGGRAELVGFGAVDPTVGVGSEPGSASVPSGSEKKSPLRVRV